MQGVNVRLPVFGAAILQARPSIPCGRWRIPGELVISKSKQASLTEWFRQRWELTLAGVSSLSDLRAAVSDGTRESPCIVGLRSVSWKVKATVLPFNGFCDVA